MLRLLAGAIDVKPFLKPMISLVVSSLVNGRPFTNVYDMQSGSYGFFSGTASRDNINIFDHSQSCHITGTAEQLFHYGTSSFINIRISGNSFNGYDYDSSSHFNGSVSGNDVTIYDFATSSYARYRVM